MKDVAELRDIANDALARMHEATEAAEKAESEEDIELRDAELETAREEYERCLRNVERAEKLAKAKAAEPLKVERADVRISVGTEERTYRPSGGASSADHGFFRDLKNAKDGDPEARERLIRNNREADSLKNVPAEYRAGLTQTANAGGEFIPPVWYIDQYAAKLRAGRPFLNALGTEALPPGTNSLNFPKITTGASVAVQSDTGSVSNQDLVTSSVTAQVQTEAGRTVASYQTVDLGPITDQVIMDDLVFAYNTQLDSDAINGNATNAKGLVNVSSPNTVTYTQATPTAALLYAPIMQAASSISKNAFVGADLLVMHPSQWYFFLAGLDSQNRPLATSVGPGFNVAGTGDAQTGNGIVGNIAGFPVCIDANIPTNQTEVFLLNRRGFQFWESTPRFKVADQTSITTLQYQFVMYGYYACTSRQSKMISTITGTGLIVQSGF